jgi:hypothetical protein
MPAISVACPTCAAAPGRPCVDGRGRPLPYVHPDRMTAWRLAAIQAAAEKIVEQVKPYRGAWRDRVPPEDRTEPIDPGRAASPVVGDPLALVPGKRGQA